MKKQINIEGMSCNHCVQSVMGALMPFAIGEVDVNLEKKYAIIDTDQPDSKLAEAIEDIGFDVTTIDNL